MIQRFGRKDDIYGRVNELRLEIPKISPFQISGQSIIERHDHGLAVSVFPILDCQGFIVFVSKTMSRLVSKTFSVKVFNRRGFWTQRPKTQKYTTQKIKLLKTNDPPGVCFCFIFLVVDFLFQNMSSSSTFFWMTFPNKRESHPEGRRQPKTCLSQAPFLNSSSTTNL